ncbi:glycosyltransferase family 2 protein [Persicimonas caeni]|jgi:glycosyltransferase involved in cell wall biosynthesis|uniref:Glycosyltransferase family 2 protein n=1 Tax=Persicimonas caeni TaxID=2292766 RepID=A0A4Y6PX42_PERCE|nr:glycosyltransferase family 2 protein [Persicimonas caeni]QDG52709.1 glycosyltransferase family 2 protein [Persicimonas caeni]QED33931.1 glycosyltransferase family 2 protein [Persicimonas caeni]
MKLIIQIPCFNEEKTLPTTLGDLPREVEGFDTVEWLIIDDGSTDRTVEVAREHGVHHIVRHTGNKGLAAAFRTGLNACLRVGADAIVNTDGDNQYNGADIPKLVAPIVRGEADMVIGDRQTDTIEHFSWTKKRLQHLGSWVVRQASSTDVPDTTSGFRAFSREGAMRLNVVSDFTYTLETIIQAGRKNIAVSHVPIRTNEKLRESRLFGSIRSYVTRSMSTIVRIYTTYQPLKVFMGIGALLFFAGFVLGARFLYFYAIGDGDGHVQSLLLAVLLMSLGFQTGLTGLLADLIANNRKLVEETLWRVRRLEFGDTDKEREHSKQTEPANEPAAV